jgi:hypothetical protein
MIDGNTPSQVTFSEAQQKWANVLGNSKFANCNIMGAIQTVYMNNPFIQNDRVKRLLSYPTLYNRDELEDAIKNPRTSELTLRNASWFFNYTIPTLMKMAFNYSEIPLYNWYVLPDGVDKSKFSKPEFKREYKLVHDFIKKINPKRTFRNIVLQCMREGKVALESRYEIKNGNVLYANLHSLPAEYCKITSRTSNGWGLSFDLTIFMRAGYHPSQFHPVFQKYWEEMMCYGNKSDKNLEITNWNVPSDVSVEKLSHQFGSTYIWYKELPMDEKFHVISFDDLDPTWIPPFSSIYLDANDLSSYKYLQQELLSLPLTSILTAQVPMSENNKSGNFSNDTKLTPDLMLLLGDMFNNISGQYTKSFFAPLENFQMHKLENPNRENIVGDSLSNFYSQSGLSSLFTVEKKPSVQQTRAAMKTESQFITKIYDQFEDVMNIIINNLGLKYKYSFKLLGDIFSKDDTVASLEKGLSTGHKNLIFPYYALHNQNILEADTACDLLDSMKYYSKLEVTQSAFNSKQDDKKNGRSVEKDPQNDNTATAQADGTNTTDGREVGEE